MRRSPDEAVLTAIVTTLKASTGVTGLVASRIYNNVPQDTTYPYVVVTLSDTRRQDTYGRAGSLGSVDVRVVSQERGDQEGMRILDHINRALDQTKPTLTGHAMLGLAWDDLTRYQEVVNGVPTRHHCASYRAWTEQSSS